MALATFNKDGFQLYRIAFTLIKVYNILILERKRKTTYSMTWTGTKCFKKFSINSTKRRINSNGNK